MVGAQTIQLLWQHFRGAVRREYISAVDTTWSVVDTQCQLGAGGKPATKQRGGSFLLTTLIIGGGITLIIRRQRDNHDHRGRPTVIIRRGIMMIIRGEVSF